MDTVEYRGVVFAPESWASLWPDMQQLLALHYGEVGAKRFQEHWQPNPTLYENAEASGALFCLGARKANGLLVGYVVATLIAHPHYAGQLCAFEDAFFLHPAERTGLVGLHLIKSALAFLKARGAQRAFFQSNQLRPTDKLFTYLGFVHSHTVYSKWLEE